jgi:hypothetical protein
MGVLLVTFFPRHQPGEVPAPTILVVGQAIDSVFSLVSAIFMLRGANWARIAFYVVAVLVAVGLLSMQWDGTTLWAVLLLIIGGAFLATPGANRFFTRREASRDKPGSDLLAEKQSAIRETRSRSRRRRHDY